MVTTTTEEIMEEQMKVLLVSTAFNGLTQRVSIELTELGMDVKYVTHTGNNERLIGVVNDYSPDLIICPYLTKKIPPEIYQNKHCIIVHPGIVGDRSASSLDWMIMRGDEEWGVTLLQADDEMDAGDIWVSDTFPTRAATKSSIYNREVTTSTIESLLHMIELFKSGSYTPTPLNYDDANIKGRFQPFMKQVDRQINWLEDNSATIVKKVRASDGSPGVLTELDGKQFFVYNAHVSTPTTTVLHPPGEIIAHSCGAILVSTIDGGVWFGHLKPKMDFGIKLQATRHLSHLLDSTPEIVVDYTKEGQQVVVQEVYFVEVGNVAYLSFNFHNGAMSTEQGELLLQVYKHVRSLDHIKFILLMGGEDYFSNGIHLNTIEAAKDPSMESFNNITAINNVVSEIIKTTDKVTISVFTGNAGAGGVFLGRAADYVVCRRGVVLNPHYQNMGLTGSECSSRLSKYIGTENAKRILTECVPMGADEAYRIGLVDIILSEEHDSFHTDLTRFLHDRIQASSFFDFITHNKKISLEYEESMMTIEERLSNEITHMLVDFKSDKYNQARYRFVHKISCEC